VSEGSWVPKTWPEAIPYIVWGILAFAFGFEGVGALIHGEWWPAFFGFGGMVGLAAMLIHWARVRQAFGDVRWLVAAMMFAMIVVIFSPYVEQQRWPFASQFEVASGILLLIAGLAIGYMLARAVRTDIRTPSLKVPATPSNIYHARTISNFSSFETESIFNLTLVFFNSSTDELIVNSVSGKMHYTELGQDVSPPVLWLNPNVKTAPFGRIDIDLEQRVPPGARQRMQDIFAAGHSISINMEEIAITVRSPSGEEIQLRHWQGVVCKVEKYPMVIGELLIVYSSEPISTGASSVS